MDNIDKDNQAGDSSLDTELSDDDIDEGIKYTNDFTSDSNDRSSSEGMPETDDLFKKQEVEKLLMAGD